MICKNLKRLSLNDNSIDDEGVIALTECLPDHELFPRLEGFLYKLVSFLEDGVGVRGNSVSEELILMCNEQLKVLTQ